MAISEEAYLKMALEDPDGRWELHCGEMRHKPGMTAAHNFAAHELYFQLRSQIDTSRFEVRHDSGRVRRSADRYYIPDVFVVPREQFVAQLPFADKLEVYESPLPLVVEVWSPSTGRYDQDSKLPEYQRREDLEIWRIHPYDRTLTAWRRQSDGSYTETLLTGGNISPIAIPGVTIDLDALFA